MTERRISGSSRRTLYTITGEVGSESELTNARTDDSTVISGTGISLVESDVRRTRVRHAPGITIRKCQLESVDAAAADLVRSGWRDVSVSDSRFTGARLDGANLSLVVFDRCKMNLIQCQLSKLRNVRFDACDLSGAFFNDSDIAGTVFEGSDLTGADFSGANLQGCDFRRANVQDIRVGPEQLKGVIVTSDQALYLARLLGLEIRE